MSILSKSNSSNNMGTPSFHEFKKQASFFLKEKIKSARLALTDVTPAELLTEEAINGNPWAPDTRTLGSISRAAFEVDDYWRIVEILHKRFLKFERKKWRISYNSLILLEHLLTHGPESVAAEFQADKDVIREMESFQFIDQKGFNWGLAVRKKSERILKLLEKENLLKEERNRARKLTRGIQGFGSFCQRSSSTQILQNASHGAFARSNSQFNEHDSQENQIVCSNQENLISKGETMKKNSDDVASEVIERRQNLNSGDHFSNDWMLEKPETSFKENLAPKKEELHGWNCTGEDNPLLEARRDEPKIMEEDHPFSLAEKESVGVSILLC
ncbi:epsin-3 [Ricinus communis]|uniref:ENTH domain-containing protein n=1 Tax=Ricinus communis TaxID=3988 RepID=B9T789_RICCO|nr:epsin-3 [Ricinus communis]EEF28276.1 protein with unknown function [Ricinus communis]|eukprot:XP_002534108.1 epsin-3 [Ricinus communis]